MTFPIGKHYFLLKTRATLFKRKPTQRRDSADTLAPKKNRSGGVTTPVALRFGSALARGYQRGRSMRSCGVTLIPLACAAKLTPCRVGGVVGVPTCIKRIKRVAIVIAQRQSLLYANRQIWVRYKVAAE